MKFAHKPVLVLLPLCFSILLAILKFLLLPSYDLWELSCCPLFTFAVLNAIIFAILLDNGYKEPENEPEEDLPVVLFAYETDEERRAEVTSEKLSNGYDNDDDDAAEIDNDNDGKNKGDYHDPEFERRIEAFIAKVVQGWREERFKEEVSKKTK